MTGMEAAKEVLVLVAVAVVVRVVVEMVLETVVGLVVVRALLLLLDFFCLGRDGFWGQQIGSGGERACEAERDGWGCLLTAQLEPGPEKALRQVAGSQ